MESIGHYRSPKQRYTLRDVYNAAKYEKNFNYVFWLHVTFDIIGEQVMKCAGYCLVVMATSLIAGISVLGFLVVIPAITKPGSLAQVCHIIWGMFLVFCIYFNYFLAVLTKPGSPQECAVPQLTPSEHSDQTSNETLKMCKKCNYTKPKRTHHCSICNQCVMKMDHHCPWVSNCVGYRNYRYFVSFLFWVTLAVLYVACISGSKVFSSGSILFPGPGQPSLFHALWGGKQRNIYSILYDLLADSEGHNTSNKSRTHSRRPKRLRAHPDAADVLPPAAAPDTVDALEHRRAAANADSNSARPDAPAYVDFKSLPAVTTVRHEQASPGPDQRVLSDEVDASFAEVRAEQEFTEDHRADHHSTHLADREHWRRGSVLSWIAPDDILIFMAFMLSLGVSFGTGMLLMLHVFLLSSGYTTIEYFESTEVMKHCQRNNIIYKHPYDRGFWANFAEVFGPLPWYLALLPSTREPPAAFYLTQDRCSTERCAPGASCNGDNELILGSTAVNSGGQGNSPVLRTSVSAGAPLWERNRSGDNISGTRGGADNASDVEEGGGKARNR